ncbi:MAG: Swt1 family HEPN domain-containing protein [Crinalium sp.]
MSKNFKFELLVLDTAEQSVIQSELNLLNSLLSNGLLWKKPSLDEDNLRITDNGNTIEAKQVKDNTENDGELRYTGASKAFYVTATGNYDWLEPKRKLIVEFLNKQNFDSLYVLIDKISEDIAYKIYPLIYRVENLLRAYIVKFMTTRLGSKWWEKTATSELKQKVQQRKNNEKEFAAYIDNNVYRIDFGDLGKLIYAHSSGFQSKEEIVLKIAQLEETPEAIRKLKDEVQSNYQRFFKKSFKDKDFQKKWEELEKIRHKIAHNNLFTNDDLEKGKQLAKELIEIIETAINTVDEITLRLEEVEAIQESFAPEGGFTIITEKEFLEELRNQEEHYSTRPNGFVSLTKFVTRDLESKGYAVPSTKKLIQELQDRKKVEIYYTKNPYNENNRTAAIRLLDQSFEAVEDI